MKLRIQGNSLRLRLTRSEVAQLKENLIISAAIDFGSSKLHYSLSVNPVASSVCTRYNGDTIHVELPRELAQEWTGTDQVGISSEQPLTGGGTLEVVIEKDFKCIHKPSDANEDAYPNPLAAQI